MIAITNAAGADLHLSTGQQLTIEQAAGWLADDELPGAFSYPIGFPLDGHNEQFLLHGYRPDHARPNTELPVSVRLEGVLYRQCTLVYRVTDGKGDGFLKIDAGEVYETLKKLTLSAVMPDRIGLGDLSKSLSVRMGEIARMPPGEWPYTFFPIRNELAFEPDYKLTGFVAQPYVNAWKNGVFLTDTPEAVNPVRGYPMAPQFFVVYVLHQIYKKAGYRITGDWIGREETQRLTILNLTSLADTKGIMVTLTGHQHPAGLFVPEMTVPDFLKAIRQRYGLIFTFNANDRTVSIRRFVDVLRQPTTQDLTQFQLRGYSIEAADGKGFTLQETPDGSDELNRDAESQPIKPPAIVVGRGGQPIDIKTATPQMIYELSPASATNTGAKWLIPTVRQPGNILDELYKDSDRYAETNTIDGGLKRRNDASLCLLSYRGMQPDSAGGLYPLATTGNRNGRQAEILNQSGQPAEGTALAGRAGVFRNSLRPFYYFRDQTRPVVTSLLMPATVLTNLKLDETMSIALDGEVRRSYLPNKMQCDSPGTSGFVRVRLTMLTLPDGIDQLANMDEPLVWVEMIAVNRRVPGTTSAANPQAGRVLTTLTIKCWADAQRASPFIAVGLPVDVRTRRSDLYGTTGIKGSTYVPTPYQETTKRYYVSGSTAIIETDAVVGQSYNTAGELSELRFTYALDPGDDYLIL